MGLIQRLFQSTGSFPLTSLHFGPTFKFAQIKMGIWGMGFTESSLLEFHQCCGAFPSQVLYVLIYAFLSLCDA